MAVMMEEIRSGLKGVTEIVLSTRQELAEMKEIVKDVPRMQDQIETIILTIKQTNHEVHDHETRITKLEARAT